MILYCFKWGFLASASTNIAHAPMVVVTLCNLCCWCFPVTTGAFILQLIITWSVHYGMDVHIVFVHRLLQEILATRVMVKTSMKRHKCDRKLERMLDARQLGLKLIANVTYGYTAAHFSGRMPCVEVHTVFDSCLFLCCVTVFLMTVILENLVQECLILYVCGNTITMQSTEFIRIFIVTALQIGDSIVSKARETLQQAINLVSSTKEWGGRVVYGDTDSMFVVLSGASKEDAFKIGREIAEKVTSIMPRPIKLKFEKVRRAVARVVIHGSTCFDWMAHIATTYFLLSPYVTNTT